MCTATYIKDKNDGIVFTTNRDEHAARPTVPPKIHLIDGVKILFPQDQLAGGSWVAVGENGLISCLMNGAEGEHEWLGKEAKKSRGQVLLDSFQYLDTSTFMDDQAFEQVHPFTLLRIRPGQEEIQAVKWNGTKKWIEEYDADRPQIWSAYTLYPQEQRLERSTMFRQWTFNHRDISAKDIWQLHQSSKEENGLLLQGNESVNTVSTTQLIIDEHKCKMIYDEVNTAVKKSATLKIKR